MKDPLLSKRSFNKPLDKLEQAIEPKQIDPIEQKPSIISKITSDFVLKNSPDLIFINFPPTSIAQNIDHIKINPIHPIKLFFRIIK